MKTVKEKVDLLVAGGGTAGHIAAIQAARIGIKVSLIESASMLGGTMTDGGVFMPNHFHAPDRPVVLGIPWEIFNKSKACEGQPVKDYTKRKPVDTPGYYSNINVPVYAAVAEQEAVAAGVVLHYHEFTGEVKSVGNLWEVKSYGRGVKRITQARELIDCTGDADICRELGAEVEKTAKRQPGTLQYRIEDIDTQQIWPGEADAIYQDAMVRGRLKKGDWAYFTENFSRFLYRGGHNCTHIYNCDTSDVEGQTRANIEGRERMLRMYSFVKDEIPGGERAVLKTMYTRALSREGYRVVGEHRITESEFFQGTSYDDAVCNAFNYIDLHNDKDGCQEIFHKSKDITPQVPFRALIPKGTSRITIAGRHISSERVAMAGIRAQCTCMAMGQVTGAAAALAVKKGIPSREVNPRDIVALTVEHGAVPV